MSNSSENTTIVTPFYSLPLGTPPDIIEGNDELESPLLIGETEVTSNKTSNNKLGTDSGNHLGYFDAVVILATFNTSGSIILIPWSYGQLGYIVGPNTSFCGMFDTLLQLLLN